jgi:TIR domain
MGAKLPRLFISHSSKDNAQALAFQNWLVSAGWTREDVFIDVHGIGAGERWRDTLRKASKQCEAVIMLASPASLESIECQREMSFVEDLGKEIIVALLRDLTKDDPRLARYSERQFVDLSAEPTERLEPFEHDGKVQRVAFNLAALNAIKTRLANLGIAPESFAWPPKGVTKPEPYPGLAHFTEDDAGIFFGALNTGATTFKPLKRGNQSIGRLVDTRSLAVRGLQHLKYPTSIGWSHDDIDERTLTAPRSCGLGLTGIC